MKLQGQRMYVHEQTKLQWSDKQPITIRVVGCVENKNLPSVSIIINIYYD